MTFNDIPIVFLARKTWKYSHDNRKNILMYIFLFSIANVIALLEPLVVGLLLNTIQTEGVHQENFYTLLGILSLFVVLELGFWLFHGPSRVIERKNSFLVRANYKKYLVDGVMALPLQWHKDHHSGDTIDKIEKGVNALHEFSGNSYEILEAIIKLIGSYIAIIYFNLNASYVVLFMFIIIFSIIIKLDKRLRKQYRELNRTENEISAKVYDTISNITTVIILRIEKLISKEIWKKIMKPKDVFNSNIALNELKWFFVSLTTAVMIFFVLGSYIYFQIKNNSTIMVGTLYALYGYVGGVSSTLFRLASIYSRVVRQKTNVENSEELAEEFKDGEKTKQIILGTKWKSLYVNHLEFSYHTQQEELHLKNISFRFNQGEKIALMGVSGSGKTTFLKLIRGLYAPKQIRMSLDERPLLGFKEIEDSIALIPQDPEIFSTTIKENITLGVNHQKEYIKRFTDMACFSDVIERLPKGINSSILEKGVNLSSGEKQRLALARGLMACEDKSIILLDEPTSSIDTKTELAIYTNIFKAYPDKTVISSIHRLYLLPYFDKIYLFDKGTIVAFGSFDTLLRSSKPFRQVWDTYVKQSRKLK